ncbi:acetyltransferase [Nodosilinea sp. P-1105]|uniref:acetyltransferase n=1 Tax=Nodosilinea sp. P-1105 TaxID=2546229 RepID=UPI00146D643B|nr:acetyltransferase [Nodosilinea sp. P-1105]NMF85219.1 acetyltransferase [Nodosilinea sp. P-1105]
MFLKHMSSGNLVEILDVPEIWDPCHSEVLGRFHAGEELQEAEMFSKAELGFPSGETLPRCWWEPTYQLSSQQKLPSLV